MIEVCPPNFKSFTSPRVSGRGGGPAAIFNSKFMCSPIAVGDLSSFEALMFKINCAFPILCLLIYRPPKMNPLFLTEFSELLSSIVVSYDQLIIAGDFNFHIDDISNRSSKAFLNVTESYNLVQHVKDPTHNQGHTLDLVFTLGLTVNNLSIMDLSVSDHMCILFDTTVVQTVEKDPKRKVQFRVINEHTAGAFIPLFNKAADSLICHSDTNYLTNTFQKLCLSTLDMVAPLKSQLKSTTKAVPWINEDIRSLKRTCRKVERQWKSSKLQVHYQSVKDLLQHYNNKVKEARSHYFSQLIYVNQHNPCILFSTINNLVNLQQPAATASSTAECEKFPTFFIEKIKSIRAQLAPPASIVDILGPHLDLMSGFKAISLQDLLNTVSHMSTSSCPLDPLSTKLLKETMDALAPHLLNIINSSLPSGCVPGLFKMACIQPLLKGPTLDPCM